ncbi:hypothetical protein [Burkholderia sp. LMG 13014]|uniref:hypothetical protein n=1 Tax=Burkholderia sp. LMG 13014 TaxID=2709306 RepID=UPI0019657F99|nr:hypothetical protein [Burkholderia sp. LMG 13014]
MVFDTAVASYLKAQEDARDGTIPGPTAICKACTEIGVPFSLNSGDGPRDADELLGIPSTDDAATQAWFTSNRWIKDKVQNFRDTFLLQVIERLGELHGDAYLAEFYAFIAAEGYEFVCLDDEMATETYVTPLFWGEVAGVKLTPPTVQCGSHNFVFVDRRIYFWTFTAARYHDDTSGGEDGQRPARNTFGWTISGQYDINEAARHLAARYLRAKETARMWMRVGAVVDIALGVLTFVPVVGPAGRGIFGAYKGVRYTIAAIDAALAANAIASGSTRLITGEDIDVGEQLFESLGRLANPQDGAQRGRQVFMFINLVMLTPTAFGGARWVLRRIRRDVPSTARLDIQAISEEERKRLGGRTSAEPLAIELRGSKAETRVSRDELGKVEWADRPSLDTNRNQVSVTTATGAANYAVMANTLRARLSMLIVQHAGNLKVVGRICKVVGDAGEEALAATMVEKWGFKAERILGLSINPKIPSRFGLTNKSGHGLDMLVWVPPPPSITVRVPTDQTRHVIDGVNGVAPTKTLTFTEETLLVFETKATLGGTKTPKFNSTQGAGGASKVSKLLALIKQNKGHWKTSKMQELDPEFLKKVGALKSASTSGNIQHFHAQVFFDHQGQLNPLVGAGSGIQINRW